MQNQRPHAEGKSATPAERASSSRRLRVVPVGPGPGISQLPPGAHNLPVRLPDFVGRAEEIKAVEDLLASSRLVTVTGSSGMGKSRLAVEVATRVHDAYANGAWLVELSPSAALVERLMAGCPRLRILATSQQPLGVSPGSAPSH